MRNSESEINGMFNKMVKSSLSSASNLWIERATEQKNPRLTLDLAFSTPLVYDEVDKRLLGLSRFN